MPLIYFEVFCAKCGRGLCPLTTVDESNGVNVVIEPCPRCLREAEKDGYDKGLLNACAVAAEQAEEKETGEPVSHA